VRPRLRAAVFGSVILRSESQGGKHEIGFTQHVSSVLGRNGRGAANAAPLPDLAGFAAANGHDGKKR
jgi:hypothetical protein